MSGNTTDGTTIRLSNDTKELLNKRKEPGESFDDVVRRLAGADGQVWTEEDIRNIARAEAEDVIQEFRGGGY